MKIRVVLFVGLFSFGAFADGGHGPVSMPKDFEALKPFLGKWVGTSKKGDKEEAVTAEYSLTSGGTAIVEKLMPGTPHEMISVFHKDGNSVSMTHYCAMGNSPHMHLKKADAKTVRFELTKPEGISSPKEPHMHALTLTLADNDTLKEEWVSYDNGVSNGATTFNMKRKK